MKFPSSLLALAVVGLLPACQRPDASPTDAATAPSVASAAAGSAAGSTDALTVREVWARATPPGTEVGAVYFTLHNGTAAADVLLSASSPAAAGAELHRSVTVGGVARMRPVGEVRIASGQSVRAEPGGLHLMLVGLTVPLVEGERVPLTLTLRNAGAIRTHIDVRAATAGVLHNDLDDAPADRRALHASGTPPLGNGVH